MPARAIKQPNGLYARFTTVVDDFTHCNYTREELWAVFRDEGGVACADGKMARAFAAPPGTVLTAPGTGPGVYRITVRGRLTL